MFGTPAALPPLFNNLELLASSLLAAKLDYYNCSRPTDIDPRVLSDLGPYIYLPRSSITPTAPELLHGSEGARQKLSELKRQQALKD